MILLQDIPWDVMCTTVTRTLHTPNVIKFLHQAHIPEASTRGTRHQRHAHATPQVLQSKCPTLSPLHPPTALRTLTRQMGHDTST
jgi:hypothetical protein